VQLKARDVSGAKTSVEKALSLSEGDQSLTLAAGDVLAQIGDVDRARTVLAALVQDERNRNRSVPSIVSIRARAILAIANVAVIGKSESISDSLVNELESVSTWHLKILGGKHSETLRIYTELARAHFRRNEFQKARTLVECVGSIKERRYSKSSPEVHDAELGPLEALHRNIVANMPNLPPKPFPKPPRATRSRIIDVSIRKQRVVKPEPKWHLEKAKKRRKLELELSQKTK